MYGVGVSGPLPTPIIGAGIQNEMLALSRPNIFLETMTAMNTFAPIGRSPLPQIISNYNGPVIYNNSLYPMTQSPVNPMMMNPILPPPWTNPVMANHLMINPAFSPSMMTNSMMPPPWTNPVFSGRPIMANPMMINQTFSGSMMTNQMIKNFVPGNSMMINALQQRPMINSYTMYNTMNNMYGFNSLVNSNNFPQIMNGPLQNNPFYNPSYYQINLPQTINQTINNNISSPFDTIPANLYPQGMLILLEKCVDIADEIIMNNKGRRVRIEHYTIHGTKALFSIPVPATFLPYDPLGKRKHFYDPKTGKTIAAIGSRAGLTVTGFAPDIKLEPYPVPDYAWWYACSPTAAGMMMGHYDRHGYPNMIGANVPDAELTSFSTPFVPGFLSSDYYLLGFYMNNSTASNPPLPTLLCNQAITSAGHITDFWSAPQSLLDPLPTGVPHAFDCLADFMGTNQLNVGTYYNPATGTTETISNPDGQTTFWWYDDGNPLTSATIAADPRIINSSGMYGMVEYARFKGYSATAFSQRPDFWVAANAPTSINPGFSFLNYKNEISAGRPVLLHVQNGTYDHTVLAFGYYEDVTTTPPTREMLLRDTWTATTTAFHSMPWGGTYPNSIDPSYPLECYLITCFTITSAPVP